MEYIMCMNNLCQKVSMTPVTEPNSGGAIFSLLLLAGVLVGLVWYLSQTRQAKDLLAEKLTLTHEERSKLRWL